MVPQIFPLIVFLFAVITTSLDPGPFNLREVHQFPNGTWLENIAVRPNGNILVSVASRPELWEVTPLAQSPGNSQAQLIHRFSHTEMGMVTGITELTSDVFAIIVPNTVWKVNMTVQGQITPTRIATLEDARSLNGMDLLDTERGTVAISDSEAGLVWRLDTNTGDYSVMLEDDTMTPNTKLGPLIGINGLKTLHDYVYYSNTPNQILCRVRVDKDSGNALGPYEIISKEVMSDDFALSPDGVAYLAGLQERVVTRVSPNGCSDDVAGNRNSTVLISATAAAFGRGKNSEVLYITTGGESRHPTNSTSANGGKVMALDLRN